MSTKREIQDYSLKVTRALTSSDGTVTSSDFDLGLAPGPALEGAELVIAVPELGATELASADTLTITVQGGASATPSTSLNLVKVITGDGNAVPASEWRVKLPNDCPRYVNVKFVTAGITGDMSDKTVTITLRT